MSDRPAHPARKASPAGSVAPSSSAACPICGKPAQPDRSPFCSKRCADVDLHRWLTGSYVIPSDEEPDPDDDLSGQGYAGRG